MNWFFILAMYLISLKRCSCYWVYRTLNLEMILTAKIVPCCFYGAMEACLLKAPISSRALVEFFVFGLIWVLVLANLLMVCWPAAAACPTVVSSHISLSVSELAAVVAVLTGLLPRRLFALRNLHARTVPKPPEHDHIQLNNQSIKIQWERTARWINRLTYLRQVCEESRGRWCRSEPRRERAPSHSMEQF